MVSKKTILLLGLLLMAAMGLFVVYSSVYSPHHVGSKNITIPSGASGKTIARMLEKEHIISSAFTFAWLTRLSDKASELKPGLYHFEGELNMRDVLDVLTKGDVLRFKVTIPEGLRTDDMLVLLGQKTGTALRDWQQALKDIVGDGEYEGLFLPETYHYTKPLNPETLLRQMYDARAKVEEALAKELDWSDEQIIRNRIMASIIEKETALPEERRWVSAVIHNRLQKNMALQMDPTVIYGIYRTTGSFSGNIKRKDLHQNTPWNTYTNKGLPPTPICNPGAESLKAAAYPADVDYLYFVADGTGGHAFASTLAEHNANVRKWIRIERQMNRQ